MPEITRDLLRKRAEHNEGMISTLEELTLHQEELESINEVLGMTCRKLKILYLQNNLIRKIENLLHCKELEYLNLALNNISKIEGLQNAEFLKKLDLTVNFIDVDTLEESINHLVPRDRLRDIYFMGNPCEADWPGFKAFVIAKLPQITNLDGVEITRSMQLQALQRLPDLERELRTLAQAMRREKATTAEGATTAKSASAASASKAKPPKAANESRVVELDENNNEVVVDDGSDDEDEDAGRADPDRPYDPDEMTDNTPEARERIYRELAKQKAEKAERDNMNKPKDRDYEKEQKAAVEEVRRKEEESGEREVKQKNEGGWDFSWDEDSKPGMLILSIPVPRHLDSSLIDVDVHPTYVSVIIKSKTLRLRTLCEVQAESSKCQRAKTNGALMIIMPKVNKHENVLSHNARNVALDTRIDPQGGNANPSNARSGTSTARKDGGADSSKGKIRSGNSSSSSGSSSAPPRPKKLSMQEQMMADALAASASASASASATDNSLLGAGLGAGKQPAGTVDIANIVKRRPDKDLAKENVSAAAAASDPHSGGSAGALESVFGKKASLIAELD